ncbi:MAG: MFS transporter [Sporolactobacillus sp.]|jgi:sugar (glycoside-pentoside-hexuronide) transporter|nr:MFS transporter [Sporolactobacillus sp.]
MKANINAATASTKPLADKLPISEKLSYSFTDLAGNMLYVTITTYIMYFYTDVFGISVAAAGMVLLIARFFDAISAPVWGSIVDHTHTKWGQSRPYFLWLAVPFGLATFLAFLSPNLSATGKVWYAGITYILAAGIVYTGIQTPINSILPSLTSDSNERVVTSSIRMVGGNVGSFLAGVAVLPLVAFLGKGNDRLGFPLAVAVLAVVAIALLIIAFKNLREKNVGANKPVPLRDSIRATYRNWPWILLVTSFVLFWVAFGARNTMVIYYAKYNLNNAELASMFNGLMILGILSNLLIPFIVKVTNKHLTMIIGLLSGMLGQTLMFFVGGNFGLVIAAWIISVLGGQIACSMPFAMLADTVDYGEWRNKIHAPGFLTAIGGAFCIQLGMGFGSYLPSKIMSAAGFVANHAQTAQSLASVKFSFIWLPVIVYAMAIIPMLFYGKFERQESSIKQTLNERHLQNQNE